MLAKDQDLFTQEGRGASATLEVQIHRYRYRGGFPHSNIFAVFVNGDSLRWEIVPINNVKTPEGVIDLTAKTGRGVGIDAQGIYRRPRLFTGGSMNRFRILFSEGEWNPNVILPMIVRAFATPQRWAKELAQFRDATVEIAGQDVRCGTLRQLLRSHDADLAEGIA